MKIQILKKKKKGVSMVFTYSDSKNSNKIWQNERGCLQVVF